MPKRTAARNILLHGKIGSSFFDQPVLEGIEDLYVLEGRPSLESGSYLCRAALKRNIRPTVIADNMAGYLFSQCCVDEVYVACYAKDKKALLCPSGSLMLGVLAKRHKVPVSVGMSAETPTFLGRDKELLTIKGMRVAPQGIQTYIPLVEWVPKKYFQKRKA